MMQMNRNKLCRFLNIMIYFIVLLFCVNMTVEHSRLIGVGLHNLYVCIQFMIFFFSTESLKCGITLFY